MKARQVRDRVFDWPSTAEFISVDADVPEEWGDNRDLNGRQLILKIDRAHEGPNHRPRSACLFWITIGGPLVANQHLATVLSNSAVPLTLAAALAAFHPRLE